MSRLKSQQLKHTYQSLAVSADPYSSQHGAGDSCRLYSPQDIHSKLLAYYQSPACQPHLSSISFGGYQAIASPHRTDALLQIEKSHQETLYQLDSLRKQKRLLLNQEISTVSRPRTNRMHNKNSQSDHVVLAERSHAQSRRQHQITFQKNQNTHLASNTKHVDILNSKSFLSDRDQPISRTTTISLLENERKDISRRTSQTQVDKHKNKSIEGQTARTKVGKLSSVSKSCINDQKTKLSDKISFSNNKSMQNSISQMTYQPSTETKKSSRSQSKAKKKTKDPKSVSKDKSKRQDLNSKIKKRMVLSQIMFQDSNHATQTHEKCHLENTFKNQRQIRLQLIGKVCNSKKARKKHASFLAPQ